MVAFKSTLLIALLPLATATPVERQAGFGSATQNGLGGPCKPVTVIFARGTTEIGNVGTATGPPFFQALARKIGNDQLAVQGVEYAADVPGFLASGDAAGSRKMASLAQEAFTKCPDTKVVLSGYSQGAQLVHKAAKQLPAAVAGKISAAVTFGDPYKNQAVQGVPAARTKIICHATDNICQGGVIIGAAHLTYGSLNAGEAADFVAGAIKN